MRYAHNPIAFLLLSSAIIAGASLFASVALAATGGPTAFITSSSGSSTNAASIPVTASFSESVEGLSIASISATNGTVSNLAGSGSSYTFSLIPTSNGTSTVQIITDGATSTASSTGNQSSNILEFFVDTQAPTIVEETEIASSTSDTTPSYTFSSDEMGTINLTGGCTSVTTIAPIGSTTITFNTLASGNYSCALTETDSVGNVSNTLPIVFIITGANPTAPVISSVSTMENGPTSQIITWTTDSSASSQVFYGTSNSYGNASTLDATSSTNHSVTLTNLTESTLYHFQVASVNGNGSATSTDGVFVSGSTASSTPLAVTGVDSVNTTATADGTFVHGWTWILHFVVPSNETFFQMKFADFTAAGSSNTIATANNVRYSSLQSSNASSSATSILETNTGYGGSLLLNGDASPTTPGRQIDIMVEVAVPVGTPTGVYSTLFGAFSTSTQ